MLDAIPGLERLEPAEQDICCGSAGIYNIVQPATAADFAWADVVLASGMHIQAPQLRDLHRPPARALLGRACAAPAT